MGFGKKRFNVSVYILILAGVCYYGSLLYGGVLFYGDGSLLELLRAPECGCRLQSAPGTFVEVSNLFFKIRTAAVLGLMCIMGPVILGIAFVKVLPPLAVQPIALTAGFGVLIAIATVHLSMEFSGETAGMAVAPISTLVAGFVVAHLDRQMKGAAPRVESKQTS